MPCRALLVGLGLAAVVGCRGPAAAVAPSSTVRAAGASAKPPVRAAFVIYGVNAQFKPSTWIVPYTLSTALTSEPVLQLDGWWVQEDEPARVSAWNRGREVTPAPLPEETLRRLWDARCPVGQAVEGACTWPPEQVVTHFDADGSVREQLFDEHACACFELPVADLEVLLASDFPRSDEQEAAADDPEDDEESCEMAFHYADETDAALIGGVMQSFVGYSDNDCDGSRSFDATVKQASLTTHAALPRAALTGAAGYTTVANPDSVPWSLPPRFEDEAVEDEPTPAATGDEQDQPDCDVDGELWSVRRGYLVRTQVGANLHKSCVWHKWIPVDPGLCPSPADACGRATAFPGLADSLDEFWVGSDERAALVLGDKPAIVGAGGRLRASLDLASLGTASIVGVRHHGRVDPLLRASATRLARRLLDWLPVAVRWPAAIATTAPPLAPTDRDYEDRRGGRDWGNRCFAHFKAGRLDAAEAACARGLTIATDDTVRGAIFHSLGRISEARSDDDEAIIYYRTSLALRHDDATERQFLRLRKASP